MVDAPPSRWRAPRRLALMGALVLLVSVGGCRQEAAPRQEATAAAKTSANEAAPAEVRAPPVDRAAEVLARLRVLDARPTPAATFERFGVNPTIAVAAEPTSAFAADPDAASWALARGWLARGALPPEGAIRTEELANAFDYGYPKPPEGALSVLVDAAPSPVRPGYHALRVALSGAAKGSHNDRVIVVVAISDRAGAEERLQLAREATRLLVESLDEPTQVSLVTAAPSAQVLVDPTLVEERAPLVAALARVAAGAPALTEALELAIARAGGGDGDEPAAVVLLTDSGRGGATAAAPIAAASRFAARGGALIVGGLGADGYDDAFLRRLAEAGGGRYHYLDRGFEAQRLVEGLFPAVAERMTLGVTFEPTRVMRYRLVGWESRLVAGPGGAEARRSEGTLRSREELTALWEIKLAPPGPDAAGAPLATLSLRYHRPGETERRGLARPITDADVAATWEEAAGTLRLAVVASAFAEKLRGSYWVRSLTWPALATLAASVPARPGVGELREAIAAAGRLDQRRDRFAGLPAPEGGGWDSLPAGRE